MRSGALSQTMGTFNKNEWGKQMGREPFLIAWRRDEMPALSISRRAAS
jgi:hypothetical protein